MVGMLNFLATVETGAGGGIFGNLFGGEGGGSGMFIVMMLAFLVFFYFSVMRPQNKKKKEMKSMMDALKKNDKVVTIGGIHGKVVTVKDDAVTIRVDDRAEITFDKSAISQVVTKSGNQEKEKAEDSDKDDKKENTK